MGPEERDERVRALNESVSGRLAKVGVARPDVERLLGTGSDRKIRLDRFLAELSFWGDYIREYPNLAKTGPYRRLLRVFFRFILPHARGTWWDAGTGPLAMTRVIWDASGGAVSRITASDIVLAAARPRLEKFPGRHIVDLRECNLGIRAPFEDASLDGIATNLVVPYVTLAEDGSTGRKAVEFVFREFFRVLKPGAPLIWSTPKKGVRFGWVFLASLPDMFLPWNIADPRQGPAILKRAWMIQEKGEKGIYSFLSQEEWGTMLRQIGFLNPVWKTTFARQAWVCKVTKPPV